MATMPSGHYSRFDPTQNYERHLYRVGRVVQGAELNETQEASNDRLKRVADALFKDGNVVRDAGINVNQTTGATALAAGVVYVRGAMRGLAPRAVTVALTGTVSVGVYLQETVVTEVENPALRDPAVEVRNASEPGAARLKVEAVWGLAGDGTAGDYYPVYSVVNGVVQSSLPPPQIDAVALAIAAYDRDSTGGHYISDGFRVTQLADVGADQVYGLEAGNARVSGRQVLLSHAQRIAYPAVPDVSTVTSEAKTAVGGTERVNLNRAPVAVIGEVRITTLKVITNQLRGAVANGSDLLPDSSTVTIVAVNQGGTWNGASFTGGTTYTQGGNASTGSYFKDGDAVNWANAAGGTAEPNTGSTYSVAYHYVLNVTGSITAQDATGYSVAGAVVGSSILTTYTWKVPRIDRLCLTPTGAVAWVRGVPNAVGPRHPVVPDGLLGVASVTQTWTVVPLTVGTATIAARSVANDGTRVQTMPQIESLEAKVDNLFAVVSEQQLKTEAALSDPTTKRGIFVDNFDNDDKRDAGVAQTAAVVSGALTLPASGVTILGVSLAGVQTLTLDPANAFAVVSQTLRTGCMLVNPYMAYDPIPARAVLAPSTDFWTATVETWASSRTIRFTTEREIVERVVSLGWLTREIGVTREIVVSTSSELVSTRAQAAEFLRQIPVAFTLTGFGAGEAVSTVKFDGVSVAF